MTSTPTPKHYSPRWNGDNRTEPPTVGDERQTLSAALDWHRATFELKCAGLPSEQLSQQVVSPSLLSLHGLARHLAGVERWWFRIQFAAEDLPLLYYSDDNPNEDFESLDGDVEESFATWRTECQRSREIVAATTSLDQTGIRKSTGEPISLRWIMVDMIAEYARHNGHADLLRERLDGGVGK